MASKDDGTTYSVVKADNQPTSGGQITIKHTARPVVVKSQTGDTYVQIVYNTLDTAGGVYGDYTCEIVESCQY